MHGGRGQGRGTKEGRARRAPLLPHVQQEAVSCAERSDVTLYVMHRRSENASVEPNCKNGALKGGAAVARRSCLASLPHAPPSTSRSPTGRARQRLGSRTEASSLTS